MKLGNLGAEKKNAHKERRNENAQTNQRKKKEAY